MKKYLDTTLKSGSPLLIKLGKVQMMDKNQSLGYVDTEVEGEEEI